MSKTDTGEKGLDLLFMPIAGVPLAEEVQEEIETEERE
jgi:hypothetical protein